MNREKAIETLASILDFWREGSDDEENERLADEMWNYIFENLK